jgi:hypothetical protein
MVFDVFIYSSGNFVNFERFLLAGASYQSALNSTHPNPPLALSAGQSGSTRAIALEVSMTEILPFEGRI